MNLTTGLIVAGAVLAVFCVLYFIARNEIVRRKVLCPHEAKVADVEVVRRFEGAHKPVRVRSCSLFEDPRDVTCDQDCLDIVPK